MVSTGFLLLFIHLWVAGTDSNQGGFCENDEQCLARERCQVSETGYGLCVCDEGYTLNEASSFCEPSRRRFKKFFVLGPKYLSSDKLMLRVGFNNSADERRTWKYHWSVLDGDTFHFVNGFYNRDFVLGQLKSGRYRVRARIQNDVAEGELTHYFQVVGDNNGIISSEELIGGSSSYVRRELPNVKSFPILNSSGKPAHDFSTQSSWIHGTFSRIIGAAHLLVILLCLIFLFSVTMASYSWCRRRNSKCFSMAMDHQTSQEYLCNNNKL